MPLNAKSSAHTYFSSSLCLGQEDHEFEGSVGCLENYMQLWATNQELLI